MPKNDVILLVGFGSIGRRHLNNLKRMRPTAKIVVLRRHHSSSQSDVLQGVEVVTSLEVALTFPISHAILANPAPFHVDVALQLVRRGIHVLIEKPLSDTPIGCQEIINEVAHSHVVAMVAYNYRFSENANVFRELIHQKRVGDLLHVSIDTGQYLPNWRPGTDYRKSVSAQKALGGGVLLELSHELDLILWIFGEVEQLYSMVRNTGALDIDVEDCIDALLQMKSGTVVNLHIDCLQKRRNRKIRVVGSEGNLVWDLIEEKIWLQDHSQTLMLANGAGEDLAQSYCSELVHFLDCVENSTLPRVPLSAALETLKLVWQIKNESNLSVNRKR